MAAAGVVRRMRAGAFESRLEQDIDDRPAHLRLFPNPSNVVKDIKLGVLLGRQVKGRASACTQGWHIDEINTFVNILIL
jgi:hypothetical protein